MSAVASVASKAAPVRVVCSECGMGWLKVTTEAAAACPAYGCTKVVGIRTDVLPYLDADERLITDAAGYLAVITTY